MRLSTLRTLLLRLIAAALIVGTAVGLRAAQVRSASTTGWRADVLVDRLETIGIALVAVLLLPSLLLLRWGRGEAPARRQRKRPSTLVVLTVFAVGLAVALWLADRQHGVHRAAPLPAPVVHEEPRSAPPPERPADGPPWLLLTGLAVVTVAVAVVSSRRRRTEEEELPEVLAADPPELVWQAGAEAAVVALRSRPQDPPRTRVLAAYEAFEAALAVHGVVRGASGTPTALLDRAVAEGFPAADALRLTELFSAARYAALPVTQDDVDAAERALSGVLAAT